MPTEALTPQMSHGGEVAERRFDPRSATPFVYKSTSEETRKSYCRTHSGGDDACLFQPTVNYGTLEFSKPLSQRVVQKIVARWADYSRLGDVSPHDLWRSAITRALDSGLTYRQV